MDRSSEMPLAFGRFLLLRHRRELLADSQPVRLGGRAFDVLMALVEARVDRPGSGGRRSLLLKGALLC